MSSLTGQGKDYFEFVKSIGESKSKQEEDRIISEEVGLFRLLLPPSAHLIL